MGYINQDIKNGSFDDVGASGTIDGMTEDYIPSWECVSDSMKVLNDHFDKKRDEWDYEE